MSDSGEDEVMLDLTAPPAGGSDDDASGSDEEEAVELTYLEHGFDFMLSLVRSETPWRGNGSGEWAPQMLDDTLRKIEADRSEGRRPYPPEFGVNYTTVKIHYATLLHVAAMEEKIECVRVLLRRGADVSLRDDVSGQTPLHMAMYNGSAAVALLLAAGADVDSFTSPGRTSLVMSAQYGRPHTAHVLFRFGASIGPAVTTRLDQPLFWDNAQGDPTGVADVRALTDQVRSAGSYKAYLLALRAPLIALLRLCASGRASPDADWPEVIRRLFPSPPPPRAAKTRTTRAVALVESTVRTQIPDEIFLTILQYWSTLQTNAKAIEMGPDEYDDANAESPSDSE